TLANTGEVLSIVNRPGNRPSHEGAAAVVDQTLPVCFRGGFRRVLLRGDTKFSQSEHLDRWDDDPRVRFIFGFEALPNLKALAEDLPARGWPRETATPRGGNARPPPAAGQRQGSRGRGPPIREPAAAVGGGGRVQL